ncbi:MAG: N-acetylmuramoyl-L-alanine amidase [Nostocaceae cyanobacterium]|nr:N-acetylmuramoyl-L-alanine amidase [Nostocaceae cyanobacterium]
MKFGIDIGHNCSPDIGATGIKQEDVLTKEVGTLLIQKLRDAGHEVVNCTPSRATSVKNSLQQRVSKANNANVDVFVSIHFNFFDGKVDGSEVYYVSDKGKRYAESVLNKIVALGFKNRNIKYNDFYVLMRTAMPAILIECCFCDSPVDMARFDAEEMANAIKEGLVGVIPPNIQSMTTAQV